MAHKKSHTFKEICRALREHHSFLVCTHVNPDPDAVASQCAMVRILRHLGKKVVAVSPEPIPKRFHFLPGVRQIRLASSIKKRDFDVAIILDCGDFTRIGAVQDLLSQRTVLMNIDHHVTNSFFGQYNCVVPTSSSTAELLYDLLAYIPCPLTKVLAQLLYTGILTDTGCFRYDNTTSHTHEVASRLLAFGVSANKLYIKIYESIPLEDLKNFNKLVSSFERYFDNKVVCLVLSQNDLKRFSEEFDLRDRIFRHFRAIKDVEVIVILTVEKKDVIRVNFRSLSRVNVAWLACHFQGGGHSRASGCLVKGDLKDIQKRVLQEIEKVI
ncbi:MAG TPA: bifunctional oligoribonuclease/PAP phosphatase NrnA [Candidatus Omnitrophota bacterium]|nr:bifunctional oligoribonuclease/PAP phosphatase NrnA [Candidatus Omnitrophota bacterium]HPB67666.1 bifunctional oligoribonuclease/PAP phosphatase NrnA [Candidatus Omnitrophota bacterium]HQO57953.1 bifunctional oligoribonuclease/PAP phosphatase NrnA [Candidatus Omnitrophota bacterium]